MEDAQYEMELKAVTAYAFVLIMIAGAWAQAKETALPFVRQTYNVERPAAVGDWTLRLQMQFLFPKGRQA